MVVRKGTLVSVYGQTNPLMNQTGTPPLTNNTNTNTNTNITPPITTSAEEEEASKPIKEAITQTGSFLHYVVEKAATSKSAEAYINETSEY
ncbi:MAG TPA: hypothetical protein VJP58_03165 [Candidatus Nitrosocosmicus sp.]|nr:hypothetical protein [Candidatus Nitrosocosmicus sp.]